MKGHRPKRRRDGRLCRATGAAVLLAVGLAWGNASFGQAPANQPPTQPAALAEPAVPPAAAEPATASPPAGTEAPAAAAPEPAAPPPPARLAIPDSAAITAADALVHEIYAKEIAQAIDAAKRKALAKVFYDEACETDDHPAGCYVLLREARELAKASGDAALAVAAIDEMARRFEVDGQAMRQETLRTLADAARTSSAAREVAEVCLKLMDEAAAAEQFATAMDYARAAYAAAKKARDGALLKDTLDRGKAVQARQQEHDQIAAARALLAETPDDPAANLAVGRYLCLGQSDWAQGLPMLAKGGDSPYLEPAKLDLAQPATPEARQAAGDRWWDLAETAPELERSALRERAGYWYRQAQDGLTGLPKTKVTRRLVELEGYKMGSAATPGSPAAAPEAAAEETGSAPAATKGPTFAAGDWVDLIPWIDPAKDQEAPAWRNTGKAIEVVPSGAAAALTIPVQPQGDYTLQVQFTRAAGLGMIGVVLPVGTRQVVLAVNYNGQSNGIDMVDGQRADRNSTTFAGALNNGRRYALEIQVKGSGADTSITAELDGRPLVTYRGPMASLSMHRQFTMPHRESLGLIVQAAVQFDTIRLQSTAGTAKFAR